MARYLRQSTSATVKAGPVVSPSDGLTPYTTAIPAASLKLSANGGSLAATHAAAATTHDADGYHAVSLDATDTGTVGRLRLEIPGSSGNYLPVWEDYVVLSQNVYDVLFGTAALSTYAGGAVASVTAGVNLASTGLDSVVVETGVTAKQALRGMSAVLLGEKSGEGTGTIVFDACANPGTPRVTAEIDGSGDRAAPTLNL